MGTPAVAGFEITGRDGPAWQRFYDPEGHLVGLSQGAVQ